MFKVKIKDTVKMSFYVEILQLRAKFQTAMVSYSVCKRFAGKSPKQVSEHLWMITFNLPFILDTTTTEQRFKLSKIIVHPDYYPGCNEYDIALLKLEKPAKLNSYVKIVCLPYQNYRLRNGKCLESFPQITYIL